MRRALKCMVVLLVIDLILSVLLLVYAPEKTVQIVRCFQQLNE